MVHEVALGVDVDEDQGAFEHGLVPRSGIREFLHPARSDSPVTIADSPGLRLTVTRKSAYNRGDRRIRRRGP